MTKRIFRNILLTAVLALLLTSALLVGTLYNVYEGRISAELRTEAEYIVRALDMLPDDRTYFTDFTPDNRVTLIAPDGSVLYDSDADEARMDSHAQRPDQRKDVEVAGNHTVSFVPCCTTQNLCGAYSILLHTFVCRAEGEPLVATDEAQNIGWMPIDAVRERLSAHPEDFFFMHICALRAYLGML